LFNGKNVAEFSQYFVDIVSNILFVIWQDFLIVWQNTPCTVCHPATNCLPHWCCCTVLPDGVIQHNFSQNWCHFTCPCAFYMPVFSGFTFFHWFMLTAMGVGRNFSKGGTSGFFQKFFYGGPKVVKFGYYHSKLRKQRFFWNFQIPAPLSTPICLCVGNVRATPLKIWVVSSVLTPFQIVKFYWILYAKWNIWQISFNC